MEGRSFAAAAQGESGGEREYVFAEKNYTNYHDPSRMIRSRNMKYIRKGLQTCIFDFLVPALELCPSGFLRNEAIFDFYSARRCSEELYDLSADPAEMNNVVSDPAYASELARLNAALDGHMEDTDDYFRHLRNDFPMPETAYEEVRTARQGAQGEP